MEQNTRDSDKPYKAMKIFETTKTEIAHCQQNGYTLTSKDDSSINKNTLANMALIKNQKFWHLMNPKSFGIGLGFNSSRIMIYLLYVPLFSHVIQ